MLIFNALTTPVLPAHQNPHKPNMTYKFVLLKRRLSSLTTAPHTLVSQTVLKHQLNTVGLFLGQLGKVQGEIRRQM